MTKKDFLQKEVRHFDIKSFDAAPLVAQFENTAFQARNLARAAITSVDWLVALTIFRAECS